MNIELSPMCTATLKTLRESKRVLDLFDIEDKLFVDGFEMKVGKAYGYAKHNTDVYQRPMHKDDDEAMNLFEEMVRQTIEERQRRQMLLLAAITFGL